MMAIKSGSTSTALVRAQADYSVLQNRYHDLQTTSSGLQSENYKLNQLIEAGKQLLDSKNGEISLRNAELTVARNQLTTASGQLELFRNLNTDLQISSNNKDNKIGRLETSLGKSQEKNLQYEIRQQDEELEKFIQQQGINREKSLDLREAYQKLIQSRENYNQTSIDEARRSIEKIKGELLRGG